jgi:hypothetical protein
MKQSTSKYYTKILLDKLYQFRKDQNLDSHTAFFDSIDSSTFCVYPRVIFVLPRTRPLEFYFTASQAHLTYVPYDPRRCFV